MSDFNETQDCATEMTAVRVLVLTLLVTVTYCCAFFSVMRWAASSAEQQKKSTSYQHGKVTDVKTSQSKQKKSTSTAVKLKDSNIKDSTIRLQEKKEKNPSLNMQNQQKNKNLKSQCVEEKRNQQELQRASQLEIRRQRQEIHLNNEIIQKQAKQIRKDQKELEKQQQKIKKNNRKLEEKLLQENEQKMNDNPLSATTDIAAAPTVLAMSGADNQPSSQRRQDNIAKVDVTEKQECVENIQDDMLLAEQDEKLEGEFQDVKRRRRRAKIDKLVETSTQITQVSHNAVKGLTEIRNSVGNSQKQLNVEHEALKSEYDTKEKKEKNPSLNMQNQQKNKNLKSQSVEEEKRNQQELQRASQLEIRRQRQEIHLNNEIIHKLQKQIRKNQQELEKQQQIIKKNNRKLEEKLLQENEQKMNDNPSSATTDIAALPTVLAMSGADNQPSSQRRQDNIAKVDVTEKQECVENIQDDMLLAEQDEELGAESQKVKRRRRRASSKNDKLLETSPQITQVSHDTVQDFKEIQDSVAQNELNVEHEALKSEYDTKTSSISICAEKKHQNNKEIKNQKLLQELEQQLLKQELRRQRQESQLKKEMIQRQEKQKRREKHQELEKQQRIKKEERRQQLERKLHEKLWQLQTAALATNDIVGVYTESVKAESNINNQPPYHVFQDNNSEVDVIEKQTCAENDVSVKTLRAEEDKTAEFQKTNQHLDVEIDNLQTPTQIMSVAHESPVIKNAHVKDLTALRDSVSVIKFLECSEKITTVNCAFKNEKLCKEHDKAISDLRNKIDNMLEKYTNLWTDIDLNCMANKVRVECENDSRAAIKKLKANHEVEIMKIQGYFNEKINDIHVINGSMLSSIQRNHDSLVCHLRSLNYNQGVRQEAALRSMRELREKTRKEHESAIKGFIEEKERLCTKHERVVRDLQETNKALRMEIESIKKMNLPAKRETAIKEVRNKYDSVVEISSPDLKNGTVSPQVERLQHKTAEKEQQRTIITARQQTTNGSDTTEKTIADNDAIDTIPQKTLEDYEQIFYETEQKLSLLHGYVSRNELNCLSQEDDLQQQLDK